MKKPPKPKRITTKSVLIEYRHSVHCNRHNLLFPCTTCYGDGKIYDPDDPPDVIEGHKLCRLIPCPDCNGTGENEKSCMEMARKAVADYKRMEEWIVDCEKINRINKLVSLEDQRFIASHRDLL